MATRLTDIAIRNLKPGAARREIPDGQQRGLYVVLQPTGERRFAVRYRHDGRTRKLTLAAGVSLAQARKEAADVFVQLEKNIDPGAAKRTSDHQKGADADTLENVTREFFRRNVFRSAYDWQRDLNRLVLPVLGSTPITEIKRKDIVRLLDDIEDKCGPAQADQVLSEIRRICNWHAARSDDFVSVIVRGMRRHPASEHARDRFLNDDELRAVWKAAGKMPIFGDFIKFLLLTGCRRDEAAHLPHAEIVDGDWFLPASRNKTERDLRRPLSDAAMAIITNVPKIAGSDFVFSYDGRRLGGMGRRKAEIDKASGVSRWVLHDLRRTTKTLMARAGVQPHISEKCLGHTVRGVEGVYDRHSYLQEMAVAYEKLSTLIEQIINPQLNVVPLTTRGRLVK
jgi:integrase